MKRFPFNLWIVLIGAILIYWGITLSSNRSDASALKYSTFLSDIQNNRMEQLTLSGARIRGVLKDGSKFEVFAPAAPSTQTVNAWVGQGIEVGVKPPPSGSPFSTLLPIFLVVGALGVAAWYFSRKYRNTDNDNSFGFTKSHARVMAEAPKTSFHDVAGCDEAKEELREVVEFLKAPGRFHEMGARIPRGVLLVGPPGSGKTHIARAVAGEAQVPFIAVSGSDFVEMFVGVGAARVRDLFETAKKNAPSIVFIDEIDAVGRRRGSSSGGGNDEREQTLNQLLVEMDGFDKDSNVIVMAATNRPDVLDPALLRPGRFDRQVPVDAPDIMGREQILRIHAVGKPLAEDVDLSLVARRTPGMVGADLENLLNEAALLAARNGRKKVGMNEIEEAADRVMMGPARKSMVLSEHDKHITANHESGHALTAHFLPLADSVHKVTIVPRGRALGFMLPRRADLVHYSQKRLLAQIAVALGGRVAEELVFEDVTTGAENDFRQATLLARRMITEWGMHPEFGHVAYQNHQDNYVGGYEIRQYSEETARRIDEAVRLLIEEQYARVQALLLEKRTLLERVTRMLLERETLTAEQFIHVLENLPIEDPQAPRDESKQKTPRIVPKIKPGGALGGT